MKALALALRRHPVWAIPVMFALLFAVGIVASVGGVFAASPTSAPGGVVSAPPVQSADHAQMQAGKSNTGPMQGTPTPTITGTPPTVTRTATTTACAIVAAGSLAAGDPTLTTRLFRADPPSTCAAPHAYPGPSGTGPFYYDTYTYPNTGGQTCITIVVDAMTCIGTPFIYASAYMNSFDPTNLQTNYLGDIGASPDATTSPKAFSVTLPAGASLVVVVNAVTAGTGGACTGYSLTITGLPCAVTPTPTATATPQCTPATFSDVHPTDYFYTAVQYLTCLGAISGYSDGTFRPYNDTTRGQLTKIVIIAEGIPINTTGGPHFSDVPTTNPFYVFVETAYNRGLVSGYSDGTFRWGNNVTRGQLSKIIVQAEGWIINTTGGPHFPDVPTDHPFYSFVETAYNHGIISGYSDGTFRPNNNATRGQISVIVYRALTAP